MNTKLTDKQREKLKLIIPNPSQGQEFSFSICTKLINDYKQTYIFENDFYTEGADDRGIDFIYLRCNNEIITSHDLIEKLNNEQRISNVDLQIFQCKLHDKETTSIAQTPMDTLISTFCSLKELCNAEIDEAMFVCNDRLRKFVNLIVTMYTFQSKIDSILITINYIDTVYNYDELATDRVLSDMGKNLNGIIYQLFNNVKIDYEVYSKVNLTNLYVKFNCYERVLSGFNGLIEDEGSLIGLIDADSFFRCICNTKDNCIKEYLKHFDDLIFENNVRSFLGKNKINKNIMDTCKSIILNQTKGFWFYNNGITILCDSFQRFANGEVKIFNLSIINGLQTVHSIERFLEDNETISIIDLKKIKLNVKIISKNVLSSKEINNIIISTNSQSAVKYLDLVAIDENLKILEYKLWDDKIDYIRKRSQPKKNECYLHINNSDLLKLIITCFIFGPSEAKNKLEASIHEKHEDGKKIIDFEPYWKLQKYNILKLAIEVFCEISKRKKGGNEVVKYASLHATYCFVNLLQCSEINDENIEKSIKVMYQIFEIYYKETILIKTPEKTFNIEQLSKNISHIKINEIFFKFIKSRESSVDSKELAVM